jgi:DNA-binding beta-propeller fold protein YncE
MPRLIVRRGLPAVAVAVVGVLLGAPAVAGATVRHCPKPATLAASFTLPADPGPGDIGVDSVRHRAYIGRADGALTVLDTRPGGKPQTVAVPSYADTIAVNQRTGLAYVPDSVSSVVTVLDGTRVVTTIQEPADSVPGDAVINPVTGLVYVDNYTAGTVAVIKGTRIIATLTVGNGPLGGAVNPLSGMVYIPNSGDGTVSVIRGTSLVRTISVGEDPDSVAVDPTRNLAYVTDDTDDTDDGHVSVINGDDPTTSTVAVGDQPYVVRVDPVTHLAYVPNNADATLSILDGATVKKTVTVGSDAEFPAIDPLNGLVVVPGSVAGRAGATVLRGTRVLENLTLPGNGSATGNGYAAFDLSNGRAIVTDSTNTIDVIQTR